MNDYRKPDIGLRTECGLRPCGPRDLEAIYSTINDGALAYKGVIPADCWHEPYMSWHHLEEEIQKKVVFWGIEQQAGLAAVMGIQDKGEVALIRHAYVRSAFQRSGFGSKLLHHLEGRSLKPILIGTWAAAHWAIAFYRKHGYCLLDREQTARLLEKYWSIPRRQLETSVVLAGPGWSATENSTSI